MNGWEDGWGLLFPPANNMKVRLEGGEFIPNERNYLFTTTIYETRCCKTKDWGRTYNLKKKKKEEGLKWYQLEYPKQLQRLGEPQCFAKALGVFIRVL